ncbi:MAG: DUF4282 domain-containing protein [Prochloraceae cyanobacterium]|nr:DUF4282 domain-containing protein [Prochloraceae cyanobacterium]
MDFSFSNLITPQIIGILYVILIILFAVVTIISIFEGFTLGFFNGLRNLILAPLGLFVSVIVTRMALETTIVLFKVADNTAAIANNTKQIEGSRI